MAWQAAWAAVATDARGVVRFVRAIPRRGTLPRETTLQAAKAGLAAVAAWSIAFYLLSIPLPYLATFVAMIMVRPTVYWSMLSGARQVAAVVLGIGLASAAAAVTPGRELALAVLVPAAVLLSQWPRLGDQGLYLPFTALLMITMDTFGDSFILLRLAETGLGVVIGTAVNLLLFPPARVSAVGDTARDAGGAVSQLLRDVAAGLCDRDAADTQDWTDRAWGLDSRIAAAREALRRGRESLRFNPRFRRSRYLDSVERYRAAVDLAGAAVSSVQTIADALGDIGRDDLPYLTLDGEFGRRYASVLEAAADALEGRMDTVLADVEVDVMELDRQSFADLEHLEREAEARPGDRSDTAELRGALLVAIRQLLHDLSPQAGAGSSRSIAISEGRGRPGRRDEPQAGSDGMGEEAERP